MTSAPLRTLTAALTDPGRKRSNNEDSHAVWTRRGPTPVALLVVCDGVGGASAGEMASRLAADAVVRVVSEQPDEEPGVLLQRAIETANTELFEHTRDVPELHGSGTTCTALLLKDDAAWLGHVGDSRAFLLRNGRIRQLTQDHSLVAQLVAQRQLTPEQAKRDSRRNVVTRVVGIGAAVEVDVFPMDGPVMAGDTFLLCSDGLHGQVSDGELARLAEDESLERACRALIDLANQRGGPDNVTVLLARAEASAGPAERSRAAARPAAGRPPARSAGAARRRTLGLLIGALIALLVVLSGLAWVVFGMIGPDRQAPGSGSARAVDLGP